MGAGKDPKLVGRRRRILTTRSGRRRIISRMPSGPDCRKFDRPLRIVPYAIQQDPFPNVDPARRAAVRAREQIAPGDFVVGYSFAVGSNYNRKNPEAAVQAFRAAFPDRKNVWLFLRSKDIGAWAFQRAALLRAINEDSRIRLYDADRQIGMLDFYAALDIYLSTSAGGRLRSQSRRSLAIGATGRHRRLADRAGDPGTARGPRGRIFAGRRAGSPGALQGQDRSVVAPESRRVRVVSQGSILKFAHGCLAANVVAGPQPPNCLWRELGIQ